MSRELNLAERVAATRSKLRALTGELYVQLEELRTSAQELEPGVLVDLGFLVKRVTADLTELRKQTGARQRIIDLLVSAALARKLSEVDVHDTTAPLCAIGLRAKAFADMKPQPKLPPARTGEFAAVLMALGANEKLAHSGLLSFNWAKLRDWTAERIRAGKMLPPGLAYRMSPAVLYKPLRDAERRKLGLRQIPDEEAEELEHIEVDSEGGIADYDADENTER